LNTTCNQNTTLLPSNYFKNYFHNLSNQNLIKNSINQQIIKKNQIYLSRTMSTNQHSLTLDNINQNAIKMEYAVRGPIVIRAGELERKLKNGEKVTGDFNKIIRANIGDCHATGQRALTFIRQVIACATENSLLENSNYPQDVKDRAKLLLSYCGGGSVGAYSDSAGVEIIRRHVAEYIKERDGFDSEWTNIVLSGGASEAIRSVLALANNQVPGEKPVGVMIPIPQYPLYSATIAEYGMHQISYYLNEENDWSLDITELERSFNESKANCRPRVLCVINPGNPTGAILTKENIAEVIKFAKKK